MGACAQSTATTEENNENTIQSEPVKPESDTGDSKTECKICDFDFDSYKGELKKKEIEGLLLALNDEYMATAIYAGVNEKFDNPRPFVNIVEAEKRHTKRLVEIFNKYELPVPENEWLGKAPGYESVLNACKAGIDAEIENKKLYDRIFDSTEKEDILTVYKALQRASEQNHKPAFERCVNRGGNGMGRGRGGRRGRN
ncbi:MAG: DUF2202 domain-containing protein [Pyrinomonadaceae bacterium]|nr:DUF2202 domain-containing protein [Pyrinomonadaceae bacterium]